ncbi:MAG: 2-oxoacid:acceptor oxidoreductase family protein [Candidatus Diapherotrites archaeon]|nr:2-oxoacid:acceptor oxidoreductase family protein [Candidatus Diapherotrites archaeon]
MKKKVSRQRFSTGRAKRVTGKGLKFSAFFIGVGGEGVLTSATMVAEAAHLEGHFVRGIQLHGLAQRGGSIPTIVRFGSEKDVVSPAITEGDADLVIAFEPLEAARATHYASKEKTAFIIDDYPYMPVYANLLDLPYPPMAEIVKRVKPFAKDLMVFNAHHLAEEEFGLAVLGNTMLLGAAIGAGVLPLKPASFRSVIKAMPRRADDNRKAFDEGLKLGKR